jgi:hypothetical protein
MLRRCLFFLGRTQGGVTPLYLAAANGCESVVTLLLDRGAEKEAKDEVRRAAQPRRHASRLQHGACACATAVAPPQILGCLLGCASCEFSALSRGVLTRPRAHRIVPRRCMSPQFLATMRSWRCCWITARTWKRRTRYVAALHLARSRTQRARRACSGRCAAASPRRRCVTSAHC